MTTNITREQEKILKKVYQGGTVFIDMSGLGKQRIEGALIKELMFNSYRHRQLNISGAYDRYNQDRGEF